MSTTQWWFLLRFSATILLHFRQFILAFSLAETYYVSLRDRIRKRRQKIWTITAFFRADQVAVFIGHKFQNSSGRWIWNCCFQPLSRRRHDENGHFHARMTSFVCIMTSYITDDVVYIMTSFALWRHMSPTTSWRCVFSARPSNFCFFLLEHSFLSSWLSVVWLFPTSCILPCQGAMSLPWIILTFRTF